jgi:hypothetical protein
MVRHLLDRIRKGEISMAEDLDAPRTITLRQLQSLIKEAFNGGRLAERRKHAAEQSDIDEADAEEADTEDENRFPREAAPQYAKYFSAESDGAYLDIHSQFGMNSAEFAQASGLQPTVEGPGNGDDRVVRWKPKVKGLSQLLSEACADLAAEQVTRRHTLFPT